MAIDLKKIKTYSLRKRKSKVILKDFAGLGNKNSSFLNFYNSLPDILAVRNLKYVVNAIIAARKKKKPVIFMMGAHVIKCGLNPVIIDLLKRNVVTCLAFNGAGIIHDFELSYCGRTSEDVAEALRTGSFGMSKETADFLNHAVSDGWRSGLGIGEAVGKRMAQTKLPFKRYSLLYNAFKLKVPVTVHVALGTDIIHQHHSCDGKAIGECSLRDFHKLSEIVMGLDNGGVLVNIGSAVMLPEVFLKALNLARNLKRRISDFTVANFDMVYQYRSCQNVVNRPPHGPKSKGCYIIGHHEIMLPLLCQAIIEGIK
ncbi:MAG: hypothetical protein COV72_05300 [Candidatus Omnitrophica bacterium CG11_big_fil_rev_8_21_14_0_20_42_13]|uniref:Deoxyhypusine synthase n=1 Tax=Candidatus Ghiorseimicrobium undicola TaxID=1974746 RepID=A0A2H0LXC7_9BACT|nr:MAG: hypothetical protein COV72_05300 [Candidatus Omnitrophica bacterium CG11_big_fil_rev_8_21_14_0_20_42_13]